MEVEVEWDPIAKRVVYRDSSEKNTKTNDTTRTQPPPQPSKTIKKKTTASSWRTAASPTKSSSSTKSYGYRPSHHRPVGVQQLHADIQQHVVDHQTIVARHSQQQQREALHLCTVFKAYPLQELAVDHYQRLRKEWGVEPDEEEDTAHTNNNPIVASAPPKTIDKDAIKNNPFLHTLFSQRALSPFQSDSFGFGPPHACLEPRLWCFQLHSSGRRYVCAHYGRWADAYWRDWEHRHAYELIRPHQPCRLYLDIETTHATFVQEMPQPVQENVMSELWQELVVEMTSTFGDVPFRLSSEIKNEEKNVSPGSPSSCYRLAPLERKHLVDLDSSTTKKFSRHWILHAMAEKEYSVQNNEEVLFMNNHAVGIFVKQFVGRLADEKSTGRLRSTRPLLAKYLFMDGACLIDLGVYTRNRVFRLLGSRKFGKPMNASLRLAATNEFPLAITNDAFYSPQQQQESNNNDDDVDERIRAKIRQTDWTQHALALAQTLVVPLNVDKRAIPLFPLLQDDGITAKHACQQRKTRQRSLRSCIQRGNSASPYPMVDDYVRQVLGQRGDDEIQGDIRAWSLLPPHNNLLVFQMKGNRWCEAIGRSHKSNNIVWNVDLMDMSCYQTCHDPDCRGFSGTKTALPPAVVHHVREQQGSDDFAESDSFEQALAQLDIDGLAQQFRQTQEKENEQRSSSVTPPKRLPWLDDDDSEESLLAQLDIDGLAQQFRQQQPTTSPQGAVVSQTQQESSQHDSATPTKKAKLKENKPRLPWNDSDSDSDTLAPREQLEQSTCPLFSGVSPILPRGKENKTQPIWMESDTSSNRSNGSFSLSSPPANRLPPSPKASLIRSHDKTLHDDDDDIVSLSVSRKKPAWLDDSCSEEDS